MCTGKKGRVPGSLSAWNQQHPLTLGTAHSSILQRFFTTAVNKYPWSYKQLTHLMFATFCITITYLYNLKHKMYKTMAKHSQDIPPPFFFNFQNSTPPHTYTSHDAHLHYSSISHCGVRWVLKRRYPERSVLGRNQLLSRRFAEGRWGIARCSFVIHTEVSFTICSRISSAMPPHIRKTKTTTM